MNINVGAHTDPGRVRDANQDSFLVEAPLFAVADGMGGHLAGDVASATAVEVVRKAAGEPSPGQIERYIKDANRAIWERARQDSHLQGMGTTMTLVLVDGTTAHFGHVGDSRAYRLRDGALEQLTRDHTLVQRMVDEGRLRPEDAAHHPQRSVITRALGADDEVTVDTFSEDIRAGDRLLLCSDGLSSMMEDTEIERVLRDEQDAQAAAEALVELANEAGGEDNITAVILDVSNDGGRPSAPAERAETDVVKERREMTPVASPAAEAPRRQEAPPEEARREAPESRRSRWTRIIVVALIVLALVVGGWLAARYALGNSYFVGADDGRVAIFTGMREDVLGVTLNSVYETSNVRIEDLPAFLSEDVEQGIPVSSLDEARERVNELEQRARDFLKPSRDS